MFEEISTFIAMVIKYPMRIKCSKTGHNWTKSSGGIIFHAKYSFICKSCGCRSTGQIDDLKKKGFQGKVRIK